MKINLICGVLFAVFLGVLGFQPYLGKFQVSKNRYDTPTTTTPFPTTISSDLTNNYQPWTDYYGKPFETHNPCNHEINDQTFSDYRNAVYNMTLPVYKRVSAFSDTHFVFSPQTMWLTLAAIAEGTSGPTRQQLFRFLNLPSDVCTRESFYHMAVKEYVGTDIIFARDRLFVADSSTHINRVWQEYIKSYNNLNTVSTPYKKYPEELEVLKKIFHVNIPTVELDGNSLVLESLDFNALWTSMISDAVIEEGPFYNGYGEQVGVIEYMKVKKHANIGFIPSLNAKVIELPLGREGQYRMFFSVPLSSNKNNYSRNFDKIDNSVILESVRNLKESDEPVEIVIPKMKMTSELDMKQVLEDLGIKSLWTDPSATRDIADPAALPSAFIQRVSMSISNGGVRPSVREYFNFVPPIPSTSDYFKHSTYSRNPELNPSELTNFVANRPFMFGVFDSESYTGHIYGSFSKV